MILTALIESELIEQGWNDIYITGYSEKVHLFYYHFSKESKNIMVLHTPVIAVKSCFESYEQLGRLYDFNVFALDYVPGEGECSGSCAEFTLANMIANIGAAYDFICKNYSDDIHLLGYTGAGGILAQYYLGTGQKFRSFAQFACGIYGDTSPLGLPKLLAEPVFTIIKLLVWVNPNLTMPFTPPKSKGFHAEIDDIHNSYFMMPELFMPEAAQWFNAH